MAQYFESKTLKENPELNEGIETSLSWILREPYIYEYFDVVDKQARIVDIGCGPGSFLKRLQEKGFKNLEGADIANYLQDKNIPHHTIDLNISGLPHEDEGLDVITAFQVVEHLENYFLILQEARRTLKKGGMFIFSIPNQFNIFYRFKFALTGNVPGWTKENNHLLFTTKDVFEKTYLKDFDLEQIFCNKGPVPGLGRLNVIPGIRVPSKTRILPRHPLFADKICYFLKKK